MLQRIGPRQQECLSRATHCRELAQVTTDPESRLNISRWNRAGFAWLTAINFPNGSICS